MKYLRYINESTTNKEDIGEEPKKIIIKESMTTMEEEFYPCINWDLINDIKEVALEYFDYNSSLLHIEISVDVPSMGRDMFICSLNYSHSINNEKWSKLPDEYIRKNLKGIQYWIEMSSALGVMSVETEDIVDQIREMYPDENITWV